MERRRTPSKLSAVAPKNAKPREKPYKLSDGGGLHLLVNLNGSKYWRLKYRHGGKEKTLALGVFPNTSLSKARQNTRNAREQIADRIDPMAAWKLRKQEARTANTFLAVAEEWHQKAKGRWSTHHAERVWSSIEADVLPWIGSTAVGEVTAQDCLAVLRRIEERGALDVASRVKQRMGSIFRYTIYTGSRTQPCRCFKGHYSNSEGHSPSRAARF